MKVNMNWQGFVTVVVLLSWTSVGVYEKLTHSGPDKSWWIVTAPVTILVVMVALIYALARLSIWVSSRRKPPPLLCSKCGTTATDVHGKVVYGSASLGWICTECVKG